MFARKGWQQNCLTINQSFSNSVAAFNYIAIGGANSGQLLRATKSFWCSTISTSLSEGRIYRIGHDREGAQKDMSDRSD